MLYLGIDQHARQITVSLRDDSGDVLEARQVSTQPEKINAFFQRLTRERLHNGEPFAAVLELCEGNRFGWTNSFRNGPTKPAVDHTDARKDAGHANPVGGTELRRH